ncbi:PTS transporter subunit EIIC [Clostridium sp.]|uniref:PTS transporter subunit EIIC n=1 Tax=Clostridium sp. TaxID=1506 RepID=UPI001D6851F9|nr:PTS transporter subunit EIIC [Clostridium sp.]MBS5987097.1 PTS transporter subunit EIIC [Clostridium sp.]
MAINYEELANIIIEKVGGKENIKYVTHCTTRLRFSLLDKDKADTEGLKATKNILGVTYGMNQYQIIMGKNLMPVFDKIIEQNDINIGDLIQEDTEENQTENKHFTMKKLVNNVLDYVAGSVTPFIPALVGAGMIRVVLALLSMMNADITANQTYMMFDFLASAPFYFMPIFVAYGASRKVNCSPALAMSVVAMLIYPNFVALLDEGTTVTMMGLPVLMVKYSNSLLPALLSTYLVAKLEHFFTKVIPGALKSAFVGMFTLAIALPFTLIILGPLGTYIGEYVVNGLVWIQETIGFVAVGVLTGAMPALIMTGMHTLFGPFMVQSISSVGFDGFFRPSLLLHNMAEGGACIGVALKSKNAHFRSEAISCAVGCTIAGVTEPAIYGITLRLKKPLYAVIAGGFAGGCVAGILGAKVFEMGASSILALPIFKETILAIIAGCIVAIVVSALITYILGFEEITE